MRKILIIGCIMILCGILSSCRGYSVKSDSDNNDNEVTVINADYPWYKDAHELVNCADLVFTGKVTNISYEKLDIRTKEDKEKPTGAVGDMRIPYTIFTVKIDKILKGKHQGEFIKINRPGGIFDEQEYILENAKEIAKEENYLFTVSTYEDSDATLKNPYQASYNLNETKEANSVRDSQNTITLNEILELFGK